MKAQKLKLQFPGTVQTAEQTSETARPSRIGLAERPSSNSRAENPPRLTNLMRVVQKFSGATLSGIAVSIQVGNILICVSMLVLGPAVIIDLLFI